MGTWQYAEGREKKAKKAAADRGLVRGCRNARDKTEIEKGHPGVESAVQRPWHSTPTHKPPVWRRSVAAFFAFFPLPSAYCNVSILSGLLTLAMCPYRLGAWVGLFSVVAS